MSKPEHTVLLVEDEQSEIDRFSDSLEEHNADNKHKTTFLAETAKTVDESIKLIRRYRFDCAIVDLRLTQSGIGRPTAKKGIGLAEKLISEFGMPIVVHSGHLGDLEAQLKEYPVLTIDKVQGSFAQALVWCEKHSGLMQVLSGARDLIRMHTAKVFAGSIWKKWEKYEALGSSPEELSPNIGRQIVSHLSEIMNLEYQNLPAYHHLEFYFEPPLRTEKLHTGDLFKIDDQVWVILTPQCDMITQKVQSILMAKCDTDNDWQKIVQEFKQGSRKSKDKAKKSLSDRANQNVSISQHFIPPCNDEGPWFVNFQCLTTKSFNELKKIKEKRFASIAAQFVPNLTQRFASYMGRIGQPPMDTKSI